MGDSPAADQGGRESPGCVCGDHGGARDDDAAQEAHEDRDRDVLLVVRLAVEQGDVRDGGGERISPLWRDRVIDKVKIVQQIPRSLDRYKYPDEPGSSELALNILLRPKVTSTTWLQERGIRSGAALLDPYQPTAR